MLFREEVDNFKADLLVMGTHTRGRLQTAMIGSLAQEFLGVEPGNPHLAICKS
jgi:nucleotide-binding universal stress UspA family protein